MATTNANATAQGDTKAAATGDQGGDAAAKAAADKATADAAAAATAEAGKASTDADAAAKAKAAETAKGAEGKDDAAATKKAPAKYELKIPDKSTVDADDVKVIETIARENDWTNEEAQAAIERHHEQLVEQSTRFLATTTSDPKWGGDNLAATQALAKAALDRVEPASTQEGKELRALLDKSGYGNHIRIVSFLAKIGKMMAEDTTTGGGGGGGGKRTVEEVLYDAKPSS
jgi:hypothetical protein